MNQEPKKLEVQEILKSIVIAFLIFALPGTGLMLFGWAHFLTPLLVFIYLLRFGLNVGNKLLITAFLLTLPISLVFGFISSTFFTLTFLPLGYILAHSAMREETPVLAGTKGVITQSTSWLIYGFIVSSIRGESLYSDLVSSFATGVNNAINHYKVNESIPAETIFAVEQTFYQLKNIFPVILPSLLVVSIFIVVSITMMAGNSLLTKFSVVSPWQPFKTWQLPDKMIWLPIGAGLVTLIDAGISRQIGINLLIFFAVVYCFQGFSIFVFFMDKWKLPRFFKTVLYITVIFQSFGTALLLTLGLSSVWLNYRDFGKKTDEKTDE